MGVDTTKILVIMNTQGITVYKLAVNSNVEHSTISRILSGKRKHPRVDTVVKIARALGVTINDILLG